MSISSELLTLNNTKTAIRTAINNKGGSVGASDTFASYATAIDNLPSGSNADLIDLIERDITSITIPSGTTIIGDNAFSSCSSLTSVTIPNSVTSIGDNAFSRCSSLTSVTIPNSVTTIGQSVFSNSGITSMTFPNNISLINNYVCWNCRSLTSVTIPNSAETIGQNAFDGCSSLASVTIPSSVTEIKANSFKDCNHLTYVVINATTPPTLANNNAFYNTNNCPIYVPVASVDAYKAASNWNSLASRIYPTTQVATVDGNPVYNYDLGNTSSTTILSTEIEKMPTGTSIEFAEGITNIGGQLGAYDDVTLPSTFTGFLDTQAINAATETLTSLATTPPMAERNNLGGAGLTAIYVPASAVDTYKAASGWSNFASIIQAIPSPTPSVTSITFSYNDGTSPGNWGDFVGCGETQNVDAFAAASSSSTFDSDIKASGSILVEDNNGNDVTSQCTFSSNDYYKWDSTQDPSYDGESEAYYEWRLDTYIGDADTQNPQSATITATYGNLSDTFTIEWTITSNCEEPEPEPDPEEPEE